MLVASTAFLCWQLPLDLRHHAMNRRYVLGYPLRINASGYVLISKRLVSRFFECPGSLGDARCKHGFSSLASFCQFCNHPAKGWRYVSRYESEAVH